MKIYTKTGDRGQTGLYDGKRVSKDNAVIEALGSIDELNTYLGILNLPELEKIQCDLMLINSYIAGFPTKIPSEQFLEKEIDKMEKSLPKLTNFILPKGQIHFARAICRRAERRVVSLVTSHQSLEPILKYLNRLSDYLFVLARWISREKLFREPSLQNSGPLEAGK